MFHNIHIPVLAACIFHSAQATLKNTGTTVVLNEIPYYVSPDSIATMSIYGAFGRAKSTGLLPMTVFTASVAYYTESDMNATVTKYLADDDVFQTEFLDVIYVQYNCSSAGKPFATGLTNTSTYFGRHPHVMLSPYKTLIPNGPYFMDSSSGAIHAAYRLYSDFAGAFTETVITDSTGAFTVLPANVPGQSLAVAVPSKLYFTPSTAKPLAGVRLGVKDIYDIAGLRTSDGNRAWYHFYPPANVTAVAIQKLIDAGAVVVGKMKTSQFANGETATADWVDYHASFNPRGDGYNDASSSSTGPGAGEASYPWLDIVIGSDTGGSIRGPSAVGGLFGNRPSHGLVPLDGVMPLSPALDTAGFLCRDPALWRLASSVLYSNLTTYASYPTRILTLNFPTNATTPASTILLSFLSKLQTFLNATTTPTVLATLFNATAPPTSPTRSLTDLLNITYPILISKQQTPLVRDPFYAAYAAANSGRRPFVDPVPLVRWAFGDSYPASALADAIANKTLFQTWFAENVLVPDLSSAACSSSLLLYVGSSATPNPRNVYLSPPGVPYGFSNGRISVFSEAPDFVVPVGEAAYNSSVTLHEEVLPVTVDFMAAKGCDGMLFGLINALVEAGIVGMPVTGRSSVGGGDVLFKRAIGAGGAAEQ